MSLDIPSRSMLLDGDSVSAIRFLSLNCWGLKYLSKYRHERLSEIGWRIASYTPSLEVVGLQECWTYQDYLSIREQTRSVLPHGKFYHSGIFGSGLVILSKWPIEESSMFRYPLNGRPTAFFRGDWFVGKGVACARIKMPDQQVLEVFNTHLHAPYEREPNDSYICHRTGQAWEVARLMRDAYQRGSLVIGLGDFNMVPMSFAHTLIEGRSGGARDVWRLLKPASSFGASIDEPEMRRRKLLRLPSVPTVEESLVEHGHTCDSVLNTWRWTKEQQKDLEKGKDRQIGLYDKDAEAKRLDYIFFNGFSKGWCVEQARVVLTERHSTLKCSLSDHFAVETTVVKRVGNAVPPEKFDATSMMENDENLTGIIEVGEKDLGKVATIAPSPQLTTAFYQDVLHMIQSYTIRERKQRRWRLAHFLGSCGVSIGCFVAIWWSPRNFVSFILVLISSLGLTAGTVDGLIGGLFVGSELRALSEFEWEVRNAIQLAGGQPNEQPKLKDWYD